MALQSPYVLGYHFRGTWSCLAPPLLYKQRLLCYTNTLSKFQLSSSNPYKYHEYPSTSPRCESSTTSITKYCINNWCCLGELEKEVSRKRKQSQHAKLWNPKRNWRNIKNITKVSKKGSYMKELVKKRAEPKGSPNS